MTYTQFVNSVTSEQSKNYEALIESLGETKVRVYLTENNIKYIPQYRFPNCKNKLQLPFDFYIPEMNICIEYNGIQYDIIWNAMI